MSYTFDHVHLKAKDPKSVADWYVKAFNFTIFNDTTRIFGDRFIQCKTENGIIINVSGPRTDEKLGEGDPTAHFGIEHFGIKVSDIEKEISRLTDLGATLLEGPIDVPNGPLIGFIKAPENVRIELMQFR